jgi:hypothetical protein
MRKPVLGFTALLAIGLDAAPAHAQATRTWVASFGDDVNPCQRTAPCKTFAGAVSKTAAGGEINCVDAAGYGSATIGRAMTIDCTGTGPAAIRATGFGIVVQAGANDQVTLRGLDIDGGNGSGSGIRFLAGGALHVQNVIVRNFRSSAGAGIEIAPGANAGFDIVDSTMTGNLVGIQVRPTGPAAVNGTIGRVIAADNDSGVVLDGWGGAGAIDVVVVGSIVRGGQNAIQADSKSGMSLMISASTIAQSATGIAQGGDAVVRIGNSIISGNVTGVTGSVSSYGNNQVDGNVNEGKMGTIPLK